jgi:hypothetical protein
MLLLQLPPLLLDSLPLSQQQQQQRAPQCSSKSQQTGALPAPHTSCITPGWQTAKRHPLFLLLLLLPLTLCHPQQQQEQQQQLARCLQLFSAVQSTTAPPHSIHQHVHQQQQQQH